MTQIRRTTSPIFKLATVGDDISRCAQQAPYDHRWRWYERDHHSQHSASSSPLFCRWRLQMKDFDEETDGGRQLNKDLAQLREFTGQVGTGGTVYTVYSLTRA